MTTLLLLTLALGVAPLTAGALNQKRSPLIAWRPPPAGSVILCALAFNLTFFWQELWLVVPKALTPGLHPVLYHNDHDWTGHAPSVELLQGTGALATLASGLAFCAAIAIARRAGAAWRLFLFWMAFEGLFQSLTQLAIGSRLPSNDVGRALAYLHVGAPGKWALLILAVGAMAAAGAWLARRYPGAAWPDVAATALPAVILIIPFRIPRDIVEVALIPFFVNLVGAGWLTLGGCLSRSDEPADGAERPCVVVPALALGLTLLVFQLVLRPGIAF